LKKGNQIAFNRTLMIEDDESHAVLVERALSDVVGAVQICRTLKAGIAALQEDVYDLIVSDLNLPDASRADAVMQLRSHAKDLPLVVLTSSTLISDGVAAMKAGADDFLVKNFDSTFKDVLEVVLTRLKNVKDAEREKKALERDRTVLREALENSNDGLAVVSRDGKIGHRNSAFDRFLGDVGLSSNSLFEVVTELPLVAGGYVEKIRERLGTLAEGSVWSTELVEDSERAYEVSISMSGDNAHRDVAVVWVRDVSERKRRERFQRELLSTTTHDLKGPLGAISVSCDVLRMPGAEEQRVESLIDGIASSARSALHLIEEFLSVRRIEEGALVLRPMAQLIHPIVLKVVKSCSVTAKSKGITIVFSNCDEALIGCVDPIGLERVLTNLLGNAVKFSPSGSSVIIQCERTESGVIFRVMDDGNGIDPSELHRVFRRFGRLDKHSHVSGTGLGLFIVKCIVSAHGGSVDVVSAHGKGATFEVFFPDKPPLNERGEALCLEFLQ
jgi:PAS domain S-box-containing protein